MPLAEKIKSNRKISPKFKEPVWQGPEVDGITQGLLSRFLVCRERFRLLVVKGLKPRDEFNHRMEYGQMWHTCEEEWARAKRQHDDWARDLHQYAKQLCSKYPFQKEQIQHWYNVCKVQFPIYTEFWSKHPDVKSREPLLQEQVFKVPYKLPSGRVVYLRGKWDSVDLIGKGKRASVFLQENKTKGKVDEGELRKQLGFDLQTMFYLIALSKCFEYAKNGTNLDTEGMLPEDAHWGNLVYSPGAMPVGVRYNVVRRPLAGGKHSIRKHQPTKKNPQGESDAEFYARLGSLIAEEPKHYFMRWKVQVSKIDLERFEHEFLVPILEQLCDWWLWVSNNNDPYQSNLDNGQYVHWRTPYGFYNVLAEGGSTELDSYLESGSKTGLQQTSELFPELAE